MALSERPLARFLLHDNSKSVALEERFSAEWFRMYLRLSRSQGFRFLPCLAASLGPAQTILGHRAAGERAAGRRARAWRYRSTARIVKLLRRFFKANNSGLDRRGEGRCLK